MVPLLELARIKPTAHAHNKSLGSNLTLAITRRDSADIAFEQSSYNIVPALTDRSLLATRQIALKGAKGSKDI